MFSSATSGYKGFNTNSTTADYNRCFSDVLVFILLFLFLYATLGIVKSNLERIVHWLDLRNPRNVEIRLNLIKDIRGPVKFISINANQTNKTLRRCTSPLIEIQLPASLCCTSFTSLGTVFKTPVQTGICAITVFQPVCGMVVKVVLETQEKLKFR